jgi:hypothetical protein
MGFIAEVAKVAGAGILCVIAVSLAIYALSSLAPAKPAVYFLLWAFVLIPLALIVVGAFAARAAYYACLGPNRSIATAVAVAMITAVAGMGLWLAAVRLAGTPDYISLYLESLGADRYPELVFLLVVYALDGAMGGIVDYFISKGRTCETRPGQVK